MRGGTQPSSEAGVSDVSRACASPVIPRTSVSWYERRGGCASVATMSMAPRSSRNFAARQRLSPSRPLSGTTFDHANARYTVLDAEPQKVNRVKIELIPETVTQGTTPS